MSAPAPTQQAVKAVAAVVGAYVGTLLLLTTSFDGLTSEWVALIPCAVVAGGTWIALRDDDDA